MQLYGIGAKADKHVQMDVIRGHFATNHSHINYYVDLTNVKSAHKMAKRAAVLLAEKCRAIGVDTIICMEGTQVIGAYLADELSQPGHMELNSGANINVLMPELNANNQMIFRDNTQSMVTGKNILLLIASVSTGKTITRTLDCLRYYSGRVAGICALFSAMPEWHDVPINAVFTSEDLMDYQTFIPNNCEMCAQNMKIDAIVNSYGFSKL